jgi:hypothetical protein
MAAQRQARQQALRSTTLRKALRWWIEGWVIFVRSGGGTVDALDQRRSAQRNGGGHD